MKVLLDQLVPHRKPPVDSEWVKYIEFRSRLRSDFWGRSIYLGAIVVPPKDYAAHRGRSYPVWSENWICMKMDISPLRARRSR